MWIKGLNKATPYFTRDRGVKLFQSLSAIIMLILIVFQCLTIMKFWKDSGDFKDIQKLIWSKHFLLPPAVSPEPTVSYALSVLGFSTICTGLSYQYGLFTNFVRGFKFPGASAHSGTLGHTCADCSKHSNCYCHHALHSTWKLEQLAITLWWTLSF